MAQGLNSTKTPARPSHEAVEHHADSNETTTGEERKMDKVAMRGAKRGENRQIANEETTRSNSLFTK